MKKETDYKAWDYEDEPKCPFCGEEYVCAWELFRGESDGAEKTVVCDDCGREYTILQHVDVLYSTYTQEKMEEKYLEARRKHKRR
ncbi:MAG: hypothetical protein DRQ88_12370 [Epsilonproteobacteria bacterium]|nr:MAG: hypothetical protein DRQ88_12370 [Campylobacterota bacterium]